MAVVLFVSGLLVPFLIAAIGRDDLALGFAVTAEVLALLFGLLSWRERLSKIVAGTLLVFVALGGVATGVWVGLEQRAVEARAQAEAQRAEAMHQAKEMRARADIERRKADAARAGGTSDAGATAHAHGNHDAEGHGHGHRSDASH